MIFVHVVHVILYMSSVLYADDLTTMF